MTDVLIYNGFTPLRRSPADIFLDNSIGMLRAALDAHHIDYAIEDLNNIDDIIEFDAPEFSRPLRRLFEKKLFSLSPLSKDEDAELTSLYHNLRAHQADMMDSYLDALSDRIARDQIAIVGIKLWAGSTYDYSVQLCNLIHNKSPETVVLAGGPQVNCFYFYGQILEFSPFDIAVYSEGEYALIDVIKACQPHRTKSARLEAVACAEIPNLIYRSGDEIHVNSLARPTVNAKRIPVYETTPGNLPVHTVIDALGCDYGKCTFCIHPQIYPKFCKRNVDLIVDEIEHMVSQGIGLFSFTASDTPLSHAVRISQELLDRDIKIEYTMLTRAKRNAHNHTDRLISQFRTIIKAGLKCVFFGVESANDAVLEHVMNKGVKSDDIAHTIECLRTASRIEQKPVQIITSFIFPMPLPTALIEQGITLQQVMDDNLAFVAKTRPDSFHAAPGLLYPGTDWYRNPEKYNIEFDAETFAKKWINQELSYHGFIDNEELALYTVNGKPLQELLLFSMEFSRHGNDMGIPTDLWDEQFIFARSEGITRTEDLQQLSRDFFLDLLVCFDEKTRYLYNKVAEHSAMIARQNTHIIKNHKRKENYFEIRKAN